MTKKPIKDIYGSELLPEGVCLKRIEDNIRDTNAHYTKATQRMRILDGADRGKVWDVVRAKFPSYQLTPDTNWVNYIKDNLVASIYTTGRYGELMPRSEDDVQLCVEFNSAMDTIWANVKADYYQMLAGERAALLNLGITMVGWNKNIVGGTKNYWYKGDIIFKNIDPMKFRRDPYADEFDNAEFCYYYDDYSMSILKSKKLYKNRINELVKALGDNLGGYQAESEIVAANDRKQPDGSKDNYHRITYYYEMYKMTRLTCQFSDEYPVFFRFSQNGCKNLRMKAFLTVDNHHSLAYTVLRSEPRAMLSVRTMKIH